MSLVQLIGFGEHGWGATLLLALLMTVVLTITALAVGAQCSVQWSPPRSCRAAAR